MTGPLRGWTAAGAGAAIGGLGGIIGLGGAEFRLPVLVAVFGYAPRPAVALNLLVSLGTVVAAATTRLAGTAGTAAVQRHGDVAVVLALGGIAGAYLGSSWLRRAREQTLHSTIRGLLLALGVLPTLIVGIWRQGLRFEPGAPGDVVRVVVPMSVGSVLGAATGGMLVPFVPSRELKVILGVVLLASALKVFGGKREADGAPHSATPRS